MSTEMTEIDRDRSQDRGPPADEPTDAFFAALKARILRDGESHPCSGWVGTPWLLAARAFRRRPGIERGSRPDQP